MFTPEDREAIRLNILNRAEGDDRISGGAITGSASVEKQDRWSDIDLAFGVKAGASVELVLQDYTEKMYAEFQALHHLDVFSGAWINRVFFLSNTLQVDLAFVTENEFGARANTFKLQFGRAAQIIPAVPMKNEVIIGWCWLYALHIRSSIQRKKLWQAVFFIEAMRNQLIALYCRRFDIPEKEGRGVDQLPHRIKADLATTLLGELTVERADATFKSLIGLFTEELGLIDQGLYSRLKDTLYQLATSIPALPGRP